MAEDNLDLEVTGFTSLKAQIREATIEFQKLEASGTATAAQIDKAAAKVGALKDQFADATETAKALGTAAGKFGAVTSALSGVAGGFTAIQGAIGLAGGDAKEFEKTMLRVQSAMALSTGLSQLSELEDSFGNLKKVAVDAFMSIKAAIGVTGIGALVLVLGALYAAMQRQAEILKKAREEAALLNNITEESNKLREEEIQKIAPLLSAVKQENISRQDRVKALKEIQKQYPEYLKNQNLDKVSIEQIKSANEELIISIGKRAKAQASMEALGKNYAKQVEIELQLENSKVDVVKRRNELYGKGLSPAQVEKQIQSDQNVVDVGQKILKTELEKLKVQEQKINNYITEKGLTQELVEGAGAKGEAEVKAAKKELDTIKELKESRRKLDEAEATAGEDLITTKYANELDRLKEARDKELEQEGLTGKQKLEIQETYDNNSKTLEINRQKEVSEYRDNKEKERKEKEKKDKDDREAAAKDEYDKTKGYLDQYYKSRETTILNAGLSEKELNKQLYDLELERLAALKVAANDYGQSVIEIDNEVAKVKQENRKKDKKETEVTDKEKFDLAVQTATQLVSTLQAINDASMQQELTAAGDNVEKQEAIKKDYFDKNKKLAIAQATISTIQGAIDAYVGALKVDPTTITSTILASLVLAAGFANIAKIQATQYQSGGSKSTGSSSGSSHAQGGLLTGPSHDLGGIKTSMGELEGGEFVVNRRSTMNFLPMLEQINSVGNANGPEMSRSQEQPIIKTYVVASEMTSQQEANAKLQSLAKL